MAWLRPGVPLASAEEPASVQLHLTLSRRPAVVQPSLNPKIAEEDAEQAITEIKPRERSEELVRELMQGRFRRPDLDRDVISSIQSRSINDALRRR